VTAVGIDDLPALDEAGDVAVFHIYVPSLVFFNQK
jgi:hypothetical protein